MSDSSGIGLSQGFAPVVGERPSVLILGSLPGRVSLERAQYYAQERNAFWPIMGELCGAPRELDYSLRLDALRRAGIALWDVLEAAERPGSLDASIVATSARVNDFASLLAAHSTIRRIFFNGRKAAELYERKVLSALPVASAALPRATLPSTSPAFAGMRYAEKLARWSAAVEPYLGRSRDDR